MNKPNPSEPKRIDPASASKEWHPNAPMNPNGKLAQPQPVSTPDPDAAELIPPVTESDDSIEHQWRASDVNDNKADH